MQGPAIKPVVKLKPYAQCRNRHITWWCVRAVCTMQGPAIKRVVKLKPYLTVGTDILCKKLVAVCAMQNRQAALLS